MQTNDKYTCAARQIADRFQAALQNSGLLPDAALTELQARLDREVYAMLQSPKPQVMVYGIYNSGKSTLVNALCEQAVAETADRPMTDQVTQYDAGKYILIDTPGVDAPIEHEKLADSMLTQCHVILFVVSSKGGFESRTNYEKMLRLIRMRIPFYIILNDRGAVLPRNPNQRAAAAQAHRMELNEIKRKIIRNLINISGDRSIAEQYEVIDLNAKRAWTGIERNQPKLVEASNVPLLRARIEQILEDDGSMRWLQAPMAALDDCIRSAENALIALPGGDGYAEKRQKLTYLLERARQNIIETLRDCIRSRRETAYRRMLARQALDTLPDEIMEELRGPVQKETEKLSRFVHENFRELAVPIDGSFAVRYTAEAGPAGGGEAFAAAPPPVQSARPVSTPAYSAAAGGSPGFIGSLLAMLPEFLKSRKRREQEKYERLCAEAEANARATEDRVAEDIRFRQDVRMQAYAYLDNLNGEMQRLALEELDQKFTEVLRAIDAAIQDRQQTGRAARELFEELRGLRGELSALRRG